MLIRADKGSNYDTFAGKPTNSFVGVVSKMKGKLKNIVTGVTVEVTATTEHPDSRHGHAVWVDEECVAYAQVKGWRVPSDLTQKNCSLPA